MCSAALAFLSFIIVLALFFLILSDEKAASSRARPDEFIPVLGKDERTHKGDVASRVLLQHNLLAWRIVEWEPRLSMQQYNLRPSLLCAVNVNLIFSL